MSEIKVFEFSQLERIKPIEIVLKETYFGVLYGLEYGNKTKIGCTTQPYTLAKTIKRITDKYGMEQINKILISSKCTNYRENAKKLHKHFADLKIGETDLFDIPFDDFVEQFLKLTIEYEDKSLLFEKKADDFNEMMKRYTLSETNSIENIQQVAWSLYKEFEIKLIEFTSDYIETILSVINIGTLSKNQQENLVSNVIKVHNEMQQFLSEHNDKAVDEFRRILGN